MTSEGYEGEMCCASCGIAGVDDVKLMPCDGCDLVRYCGDACRELHKSEHEEECKKRNAELSVENGAEDRKVFFMFTRVLMK